MKRKMHLRVDGESRLILEPQNQSDFVAINWSGDVTWKIHGAALNGWYGGHRNWKPEKTSVKYGSTIGLVFGPPFVKETRRREHVFGVGSNINSRKMGDRNKYSNAKEGPKGTRHSYRHGLSQDWATHRIWGASSDSFPNLCPILSCQLEQSLQTFSLGLEHFPTRKKKSPDQRVFKTGKEGWKTNPYYPVRLSFSHFGASVPLMRGCLCPFPPWNALYLCLFTAHPFFLLASGSWEQLIHSKLKLERCR